MIKSFLLPFFIITGVFTQDISSMKTWENILQTPELVEYFRGIFNHLGISIEETGESFTIHHTGQGFASENRDEALKQYRSMYNKIQDYAYRQKIGVLNKD